MDPDSANEALTKACVEAIRQASHDRGLQIEVLEVTPENRLQVVVQGASQRWNLVVECLSRSLTQLPHVRLKPTGRLHPHVGYFGTVCVSDNLGLSLDPDRRADVVAYTVLAAIDLLEKWDADKVGSAAEFFNEVEGYWSWLPGSIGTSGAFDADGKDRLVTSYLKFKEKKPQWFFTERDVPPTNDFDVKGAAAQSALYIHMEELAPPPVRPEELTAAFVAAIRSNMSAAQLALWARLVRPSSNKNHPKRAVLLVSVPRQAGGVSVIGIEFGTRNGDVDLKAPVMPLTMRRLTAAYMRERGGAATSMLSKHVVIIGCGAIGAVIADALAATGVGQLTLVDYDDYSEDNVFRHILDPVWIETPKVHGLKYQLERQYRGLKVTPRATHGQEWLRGADLSDVDAVVFALGLPTLERAFSGALRKRNKQLPMLFTWLEPLDLGGHSVLAWMQGEGCLDCLYRDDEGVPSLQSRIAFLTPNQPVSKTITGCGSVFVPYGALQSRRTGLMAAEHVLSALSGATGSFVSLLGWRRQSGSRTESANHAVVGCGKSDRPERRAIEARIR
ncbi:ThiF family adenylyltransferase [Rugamonas sp. DEMB1]|uniref:ThiF family adenylyltransferase n=1 Tax=Rugamonas sp. DEMB1 TaxID=3039386 RepID=UPI00244C68A9|nr:ThiF family adenylyltransferase [Rugamonas sp. DEMB1]WGG48873.1 ThiF family adenylyltransferase [Rugamonas sp. DEMB1]